MCWVDEEFDGGEPPHPDDVPEPIAASWDAFIERMKERTEGQHECPTVRPQYDLPKYSEMVFGNGNRRLTEDGTA